MFLQASKQQDQHSMETTQAIEVVLTTLHLALGDQGGDLAIHSVYNPSQPDMAMTVKHIQELLATTTRLGRDIVMGDFTSTTRRGLARFTEATPRRFQVLRKRSTKVRKSMAWIWSQPLVPRHSSRRMTPSFAHALTSSLLAPH